MAEQFLKTQINYNDIVQFNTQRQLKLKFETIESIAISLDSRNLVALGMNDSIIRILDTKTWKFSEIYQEFIALHLAFSQEYLVSAGRNNKIRLWSASNFEKKGKLKFELSKVSALAISINSKYLVSCHDEKLVRIWHVKLSQCGIPIRIQSTVTTIQIKEEIMFISEQTGIISCYNLETRMLIKKIITGDQGIKITIYNSLILATNQSKGMKSLQFWNSKQVRKYISFPRSPTISQGILLSNQNKELTVNDIEDFRSQKLDIQTFVQLISKDQKLLVGVDNKFSTLTILTLE